jgi:hypothetical protein
MTTIVRTRRPTGRERARNAALLEAERVRAAGVHEADVEYGETVLKLREAFERDVADASARRRAAVLPVHRAYNAAVIAAERIAR